MAASAGPALPLSMAQAMTMALDTNLGLKADRLDVNIAAENIRAARAAFRPLLRSSFSRNTSDQLPSSFVDSDVAVVSSGFLSANTNVSQALRWFGGAYTASWSGNRATTSSNLNPFNPRLGSTLQVGFQQPLLRNFKIDGARAQLEESERSRQIADLTLEQRITATRSAVQVAYLGLIAALEGSKVAQQNMDLAQRSLQMFRQRVAVGVSADIEVIQAEAVVARNEEQVVVAGARIDTAMDNLRSLILDSKRPDFWQVRLQPTDTITAVAREIDVDGAIRNALSNRLDLISARRQRENTLLGLRLSENQIKPDLSLNVNYAAQGTGGTQLAFGSGFPPEIIGRSNRGFGNVLGDAFLGTYPSWTVGATFSYPLGLSAAKASLARAQVQKQQADLAIENLELQISTQVRTAARNVQTNVKRLEATRKAREATERQLEAENRKFGVGLSSAFELQTREGELANSRVSELNAMIDYNQSLIIFERVQRIQ